MRYESKPVHVEKSAIKAEHFHSILLPLNAAPLHSDLIHINAVAEDGISLRRSPKVCIEYGILLFL